jgi:hypothetical protein
MSEEDGNNDPFVFQLLSLCLEEEQNNSSYPDGLSDKELFSSFAFVVVAVAFLALTVGPYSLLK